MADWVKTPGSGVTVVVGGVDDSGVAAETEAAVRRAFGEAHVRGKWKVTIAASSTRGRWDVTLTGPSERHLLSFTASVDRVPDLAAQYVKRGLSRVKAP